MLFRPKFCHAFSNTPIVQFHASLQAVALFTELEINGLSNEDRELLHKFRSRIDRIVVGEEDGKAASELLAVVLKNVVREWSGLPPGWDYDEDKKIWMTQKGGISSKTRPTENASVALAKKKSASGSLARAEKELGGGKGGDRGAAPATIMKASNPEISAPRVTEKEAKLAVKQRLKAEEDREKRAASKSNKVTSVTKMLQALDLEEKYALSNISDDLVKDILGFVKEGEKEEAEKGIYCLIADAGMIGGSASRVRRYLLDGGKAPKGKSKAAAAASATVAPPAAAAKKVEKNKNKKDDLSLLDWGGGEVGKKKRRGGRGR